jgi:hypothetical protein
MPCNAFRREWTMEGLEFFDRLMGSVIEADKLIRKPLPLDENWMRVAPGTDAAIWRTWSRETGEL